MSSSSSSSHGGVGFIGLLTIVFITLKLLGKIDWPWRWVISPIWITACLVIVMLVVGITVLVCRDVFMKKKP